MHLQVAVRLLAGLLGCLPRDLGSAELGGGALGGLLLLGTREVVYLPDQLDLPAAGSGDCAGGHQLLLRAHLEEGHCHR